MAEEKINIFLGDRLLKANLTKEEMINQMAAGMFDNSWQSEGYYIKGRMKFVRKKIHYDDLVDDSKAEWEHLAKSALKGLLGE